jgi:hypothetical protein
MKLDQGCHSNPWCRHNLYVSGLGLSHPTRHTEAGLVWAPDKVVALATVFADSVGAQRPTPKRMKRIENDDGIATLVGCTL